MTFNQHQCSFLFTLMVTRLFVILVFTYGNFYFVNAVLCVLPSRLFFITFLSSD